MNTQLVKQIISSMEYTCTLLCEFIQAVDEQVDTPDFEVMEQEVVKEFIEYKFECVMKSTARQHDLVTKRNICCYLLRKYADLSLKSIGALMGKDHTTVINSLKTLKSSMKDKPAFKAYVNRIEGELKNYALKFAAA
jgi:chromosomal replication initiation ATPase DnaA